MDSAASNPSYRAHWNLRETPFAGGLNPRYFFPSPAHDEALARLHYLVERHQRLGLLLGEAGTGKSFVLDVLARDMRRVGGQVANISLLGLDLHEFMWLLAAELGLNPNRDTEVFSLWRAVSDRLLENRYQQLDTVVLLDDAEDARPEVLDHVARLVQVNRGEGWPLVAVVSVAADRVSKLGSRLLELAELRIDLEAWEEVDTSGYISATLTQAGCKTEVFTDDAIHRLQTLTGGVPRRVNQLASLALVAGAGRRMTRIDADTIESVYHELGLIEAVA